MSWLRLSYCISSRWASMQGGTQACVFCPPMCNARDRWVGFCLIYPRRRQLKQPRKQPAVVSSCHKDYLRSLKIPMWTFNASTSPHMEMQMWKPKPKEWICEHELTVQARAVVLGVDWYPMILQPMLICKWTSSNISPVWTDWLWLFIEKALMVHLPCLLWSVLCAASLHAE